MRRLAGEEVRGEDLVHRIRPLDLPVLALMLERLGPVPETQDDLQRLAGHGADVAGADAEHGLVGGDGAGGHAEVQAAVGQMVQHHQPAGQGRGMMHGQEEPAGAQADIPGLGEAAHEQQVRRRIGLPGHRVMLADPGLAIAQLVQPADDLQVELEARFQVPLGRVGRHGEKAELHGTVSSGLDGGGPVGARARPAKARVRGAAGRGVNEDDFPRFAAWNPR